MAAKRITDLPNAEAITGAEFIEVSQVSTTIKVAGGTISAAEADNSFSDSGAAFLTAGFAVGDRVNVIGFANPVNNLALATVTALTSGRMTIGGTEGDAIVDAVTGPTVTIAKWISRKAVTGDIGGGGGSVPDGGTTGQVLGKLSDTDGDADWIDQSGGTGGGSASFSGCRVRNSAAASSSMTANVDNLLSWDTEDFDVGGWHNTVTNPSRLTVPSGVNYVEVTGCAWSQANRTGYSVLWLRHYNSSGVEQPLTIALGSRNASFNAGNWAGNPNTGVVAVNAGDYFTLSYQDGDGGNPNIPANQMWFSIRAVG